MNDKTAIVTAKVTNHNKQGNRYVHALDGTHLLKPGESFTGEFRQAELDSSISVLNGNYEVVKRAAGKIETQTVKPVPRMLKTKGAQTFYLQDGDETIVDGISKEDADNFGKLSDEDKQAFAALKREELKG